MRRFQDDDETMVFLGNPAAAGAGLTLHRSRGRRLRVLFEPGGALHAEPRPHPSPRPRPQVEYVVLLCEDSFEEDEYARILSKVDSQADLLGDPRPHRPTRTLMLDELLDARRRIRD